MRRVVEKGRRRVGDQAWDQAYRRGRVMDRAEAIARLDPDRVLEERLEERLDEQDPATPEGDGVVPIVGAGQARRR